MYIETIVKILVAFRTALAALAMSFHCKRALGKRSLVATPLKIAVGMWRAGTMYVWHLGTGLGVVDTWVVMMFGEKKKCVSACSSVIVLLLCGVRPQGTSE